MHRSKRFSPRSSDTGAERPPPQPAAPAAPPAGAPDDAPTDGDHNQGGARPEGLDYQRDLGHEQDA
ncbi:TPA: hypothetical protein QDB02_004319 [Burkholderia vietnamiensis]|nr:hypothetical protein [Burkholderia vietnamiensis]